MQHQYTKPYGVLGRLCRKSQLIKEFEKAHHRSPTMEEAKEIFRSKQVPMHHPEGWDL